MEGKARFMLNKLPSYLLPRSVSGGDGRVAGKALQMEQDNVRKLIADEGRIILGMWAAFVFYGRARSTK